MTKNTTSGVNHSWGGRFSSGLAPDALLFSESQSFDRHLYKEDIAGSKAHAAMLAQCGIIKPEEAELIRSGLDQIQQEIETGQFKWKLELEDVHMNIENRLTELIGEPGKKLHTARSRNDQIALDFRLHVSGEVKIWQEKCAALCLELCDLARSHIGTILPGLTHFQPAQPISLAQHLLAYAFMFKRDWQRMADALCRIQISPLGAAALAGSTYPINPGQVARELGFAGICGNSMDAVSDRDFALEAIFCASLMAMHLSRLSEELIIWSNPAFGYIILPDEYSTGSSIMPQKKNPDMAELIRGKTGRVFGSLMALLTIMKGLPLAYNRDLQEDKECFFDVSRTISASLGIMANMLAKIHFNPEKMAKACANGFINATELADYLAGKGVPFRDAHHITGQVVAWAEKNGKKLEELTPEELRNIDGRIGAEAMKTLDYHACLQRRKAPGGVSPQSVCAQLQSFEEWFARIAQSE